MRDLGGTFRERSAADTWRRIAPLMAGYGITRVADLTALDVLGVPVFAATRPGGTTVTCSQGKGATALLARISAVMEGIETAVAEQYRPASLVVASHRERQPGYPLEALPLATPSTLTADTRIGWVPAVRVVDGEPSWAPHDVVSLCQAVDESWFPTRFARASNGLASGNTVDEAALHALWELIERDCTADFSLLTPDERVYLDPHSVTDPGAAELITRMTGDGFRLEIVDMSGPFRHACAVYLHHDDMADVFGGAGAHADPAIALSRALTEAAQSRLAIISGVRDDIPDDTFRPRRVHVAWTSAASATTPWSTVTSSPPLVDVTAPASTQLRDLARHVERVTGHAPLVVDLSPDHGVFAVVRVVAPGLRHDSRNRFARPSRATTPEGGATAA